MIIILKILTPYCTGSKYGVQRSTTKKSTKEWYMPVVYGAYRSDFSFYIVHDGYRINGLTGAMSP